VRARWVTQLALQILSFAGQHGDALDLLARDRTRAVCGIARSRRVIRWS
jgi:hypothetical protein